MDNRCQISIEYLIILAVLLVISAVVTLLAANVFSVSKGIGEIKDQYIERAKDVLR